MRILIISPNKGLYNSVNSGYNGVGWIAALQTYLEKEEDIELGLTFVSNTKAEKIKKGNTVYYPLYVKPQNRFEKIITYWGKYKKDVFNDNIKYKIKEVIDDFCPDVIHVFCTESDLPYTTNITDIPCIIHIQGLLSPISNIYYPPGISKETFNSLFDIKEFWLRNGINFNYKRMRLAAEREKSHIKNGKYFMGRTDWDRSIIELYNPGAKYFHINEVLRAPFYDAKKWEYKEGKLILVSTISGTIYKGVDIIMKTAAVLKETGVDFQWNVIGINNNNKIIKKIEKSIGINANSVNIKFLGVKSPDEIIEILHSSTIYVHPSHIDNSPNSLCEAQYIGIPTIATNVGGIPTIMEHNLKYLVPSTDAHSLAHKIIEIESELRNGSYKNIYKDVAERRHDPHIIIEELKNVYRNIVK